MDKVKQAKEWVMTHKKQSVGLVICAVLLFVTGYALFLHNRVSTTSFRVRQSSMDEEDFYDYADEHGSELSFSLQSPGVLTEEVEQALLDGRESLGEGIYTWVDEDYEETHVVLVSEDEDLVSGIYGVHKEGDDVLIGWSSENWQTEGNSRTHIVHLVIDDMLDESENQFHLVDVNIEDDVSELVTIPIGGEPLSEEEEAEIEAQLDRDRVYVETMTSYFSTEMGLTFEEWQGLPLDEQEEKAQEAGFDSLSDLNHFLDEQVAPEYTINIDAELEALYQRYFGLSLAEMAELDGEAYRAVIDASDLTQEEFQEMVSDIIDQKEEGL